MYSKSLVSEPLKSAYINLTVEICPTLSYEVENPSSCLYLKPNKTATLYLYVFISLYSEPKRSADINLTSKLFLTLSYQVDNAALPVYPFFFFKPNKTATLYLYLFISLYLEPMKLAYINLTV